MTTQPWDDDRIMAELAKAIAPPEVAPELLEAARALFTWRTVDAELAALAYDSAVSGDALAGVRGGSAMLRSLSFEAPGLVIELDVTGSALVGQVMPSRSGLLEVLEAHGVRRRVPVDAAGCFRVSPQPSGTFRLELTTEQGYRVVTDPVTV